MKINLTIEITDDARKRIVQIAPELPTTKEGLATRQSVHAFIQWWCDHWDHTFMAPQSVEDAALMKEAVEHLRKCGWNEERIVQWMYTQHAKVERAMMRKPEQADVEESRDRVEGAI